LTRAANRTIRRSPSPSSSSETQNAIRTRWRALGFVGYSGAPLGEASPVAEDGLQVDVGDEGARHPSGVGETRRDDRYFRPDRNPVVLAGLRTDTVNVDAGRFATTVIRPSIKANGIFSQNGDAQLWLSTDANRYPVLLKSKFAKFSLTLELQTVKQGDRVAQGALIADVLAAR